MARTLFLGALFLCLSLTACDGGSSDDGGDTGPRTLVLFLDDIEPLPNSFHYEGWVLITSGGAVTNLSTGKFNVDANGDLVDLSGNPIAGNAFATGIELERAARFFITIEPAGDTDTMPSPTRLLGGDLVEGRADLSTGHRSGLSEGLNVATGTFIVATPTDGPDTNEESGVWFINLTAGSPARGLLVPTPLPGWIYQGWVVIDGITVTTGTIQQMSQMDDAAPHSGPMEGFSYPGEDFLVNPPPGLTFPISVAGAVVIVTLEPSPDPDPAMSPFQLLTGSVPATPMNDFTYNLTNNTATFPTGVARIRE